MPDTFEFETPPAIREKGPTYADMLNARVTALQNACNSLKSGAALNDEAIKEPHIAADGTPDVGAILTSAGSDRFAWLAKLLFQHMPISGDKGANYIVVYQPAAGETPEGLVYIATLPVDQLPMIPESKLDIANAPVDGGIMVYSLAEGMKWAAEAGMISTGFLNVQGSPVAGYVIKVRADGKWEFSPTAAINDSGAVRLFESDPMDYVQNKGVDLARMLWQ